MGRIDQPKKGKQLRHDPLHVQIDRDRHAGSSAGGDGPKKQRLKYQKREQERAAKENEDLIDEKISRRILDQAKQQMEEDESAEVVSGGLHSNLAYLDDDEDDQPDKKFSVEEFQEEEGGYDEYNDAEFAELGQELRDISDADRAALSMFMSERPPERRTLADVIMEKFKEAADNENAMEGGQGASPSDKMIPPGLNPKVVDVYTKVGILLSRYKSGKLPKAFKIISSLSNWEEILYLTRPEEWTPHAMYQATRLFASNLKPKMAQRFYNLILLDAVREDIQTTKKVNYHLYMALKKALYKPAAWFKGLLLPLCESGCTLREAIIFGSVLSKVSVPVLHSSAALLKLAEMEYTGANSIFIRILLDKKYALPYRVIDSLVMHFLRFRHEQRVQHMPVLWHQSLLVFAQRYKEDMAPEQKEALLELLKYQSHPQITPEIRRELVHSKCRDDMKMDVPTQPATSNEAAHRAMNARSMQF